MEAGFPTWMHTGTQTGRWGIGWHFGWDMRGPCGGEGVLGEQG